MEYAELGRSGLSVLSAGVLSLGAVMLDRLGGGNGLSTSACLIFSNCF